MTDSGYNPNDMIEIATCYPAEAARWLRDLVSSGQAKMRRNGKWIQEFHAGNLEMFEQTAALIHRMRNLIDELGQLMPCEKPEIGPMPRWIQDLIDRRKKILGETIEG